MEALTEFVCLLNNFFKNIDLTFDQKFDEKVSQLFILLAKEIRVNLLFSSNDNDNLQRMSMSNASILQSLGREINEI